MIRDGRDDERVPTGCSVDGLRLWRRGEGPCGGGLWMWWCCECVDLLEIFVDDQAVGVEEEIERIDDDELRQTRAVADERGILHGHVRLWDDGIDHRDRNRCPNGRNRRIRGLWLP